jgi:hypothetical protein
LPEIDPATGSVASATPVAASLAAREILSAAWPLFKACLPVCLPLAVVGVASGATPGSEAAMSGGGRSLAWTREWWGLTAASVVLTLICYGAVLRQQLALAGGSRAPVLDSLRRAAMDVPFVLVLLLLMSLPLVPAMLLTAWRGFGVHAAALTLGACALLVGAWFAWVALVANGLNPFAAVASSFRLVRGRWLAVVQVAFALIAAVLVFVLLTAIFIGVVMGLAGQDTPDARGLALSRWLMALILAVPVVYGGAVTVTAWRALSAAPASRDAPAPRPAA